MRKELEKAINNIKIITGQARLTREEHTQIINDIDLIVNELGKEVVQEG